MTLSELFRVVIQRQPITRFEDDPETRATLSGHSSRCGLGSYTAGETVYSDVSDKGYSEYEFELDHKVMIISRHHLQAITYFIDAICMCILHTSSTESSTVD